MARYVDQPERVRVSTAKRVLLIGIVALGAAAGALIALPADRAEAGVWCRVYPGGCVYVEK